MYRPGVIHPKLFRIGVEDLILNMVSSESDCRCGVCRASGELHAALRLMDKILHDPKDPKLWELWYIPYNG